MKEWVTASAGRDGDPGPALCQKPGGFGAMLASGPTGLIPPGHHTRAVPLPSGRPARHHQL